MWISTIKTKEFSLYFDKKTPNIDKNDCCFCKFFFKLFKLLIHKLFPCWFVSTMRWKMTKDEEMAFETQNATCNQHGVSYRSFWLTQSKKTPPRRCWPKIKSKRDNEHPCGFTKAHNKQEGEENSQDEIQQVTKAEEIFR